MTIHTPGQLANLAQTPDAVQTSIGSRLLDRSGDYRAHWTTASEAGWLQRVGSLISAWLKPKFDGSDLDLSVDADELSRRGHSVQVRHHHQGHERAVKFMMVEQNRGGTFTSSLIAVENDRGEGWISLEIKGGRGTFVNVPNLAGDLLASFDLNDVETMSPIPRSIHMATVDEVLSLVEAPGRRGPLFIAATDHSIPFDKFVDRVGVWTKEIAGLGQAFVLDPASTTVFNERVGPSWTVPAWTMRTYRPGIALDNLATARASRILSTERLGKDRDRDLAKMLGRAARDIIATHPTPSPVVAWSRTFERLALNAATAAVVRPSTRALPTAVPLPAKSPSTKSDLLRTISTSDTDLVEGAPRELDEARLRVDSLLGELMRVKDTLGLPDLSDSTLFSLLDDATAERVDAEGLARIRQNLEQLQDEKDALDDELELSKLEHLIVSDELETAEKIAEDQYRRISYLTSRLAISDPEGAYGETGEVPYDTRFGLAAESFMKLFLRLPEIESLGVVVSATERSMRDLDKIDVDGKAVANAWSALICLCDYVRAKRDGEATGSVHKYLEDQPSGYYCHPLIGHASNESSYTRRQYVDERTFRVPASVSSTGKVPMLEHFRLARIARLDPRLHYYDDTSNSGLVYVGYIGPHLTNSMTST